MKFILNKVVFKLYLIWKCASCPFTVLNRPLGPQEVEAARISRHSAQKSGKLVSPTQRASLLHVKYSWCSFMLEADLTPGEGLCQ